LQISVIAATDYCRACHTRISKAAKILPRFVRWLLPAAVMVATFLVLNAGRMVGKDNYGHAVPSSPARILGGGMGSGPFSGTHGGCMDGRPVAQWCFAVCIT
jgi:hypothetical protein